MNQHSASHRAVHTLLAVCLVSIPLGLTLFFPQPPLAHAAAITVNTLDDTIAVDEKCSLREAIQAANTNLAVNECSAGGLGMDTITITATGTISLSTMLPILYYEITINGPGANNLTISGNNAVRVMQVHATGNVILSNVTIANGHASGANGGGIINFGLLSITTTTFFGNSAGQHGGGIMNNALLTVTNSTFYSNTASVDGGGIFSNGGLVVANTAFYSNTSTGAGGGILNGGALSIASSTFSGNSANFGGGLGNSNGTITITNSAFYSNTSSNIGGGIANVATLTLTATTFYSNAAPSGGGIYSSGTLDLINSTFHKNSASDGGGLYNTTGAMTVTHGTVSTNNATTGGGIFHSSGTVTLRSTIIANNTASTGANCSGTMTSQGYNLDNANTCALAATGDLTNTNPLLGPLGNNGGATQTMALFVGSLAINRIPNGTNGCGTSIITDQRGESRPIYSTCDIGAYEYDGAIYPLYLPLIMK